MIGALNLIWGKFAGIIVSAISIVVFLFGYRYKIIRGTRNKWEDNIRDKSLERFKEIREIEQDTARIDPDSINDELRDKKWIRE